MSQVLTWNFHANSGNVEFHVAAVNVEIMVFHVAELNVEFHVKSLTWNSTLTAANVEVPR